MKTQENESKFVKIRCPRCKQQQIIFGKASTKVKCKHCNAPLVKTTGGKVRIKAEVKGVFRWLQKKII